MTLPSYVGRYEVRSEIAKGAFAVVALAWDEELQSFVALKILHENIAQDREFHDRFLDEARLLRRVRATNVVTIHDIGRLDDGRPYFVLDYADRGTLEPRLERSGSAPPSSASIMALADAMTDGLSALHDAGLIHRDIKPANILFQLTRRGAAAASGAPQPTELVGADERILVGDLGIAKDTVARGLEPTMLGGTPLYRAPEQMEQSSRITPAADVYAATAILWHLLAGQRPPLPHLVESRLDSVPPAWSAVMRAGMTLHAAARLPDMGSWRDAVHQALAEQDFKTEAISATAVAAQTKACPYKGLAAYQPDDSHYFCGREALIDELVRRVQIDRILVVGGPSGSGKSSLVRAGLIPALKAGALRDSESWRIALFTPGRIPLAELHYQVTKSSGTTGIDLENLLANPSLARDLDSANGSGRPLLLCIDQFEEIFSLAISEHREKFFAALAAMTESVNSNIRLVIAVRADFYDACAQVPWLAEHISRNQVLVGPMTQTELRRAITEPARRAGLILEPGLVDAMVKQAGDEAGSLPLVAHALVETWNRRNGNSLTVAGFQDAGGVTGAISQTAEAAYTQHFEHDERTATKRLFLRLVNSGGDTPDTRRLLPISEIDNDTNPTIMRNVVERLTDARLLTVDDGSVQIAHEALLQTWPRLRGWIEEARDDLRIRQRVANAATEWNAEGRELDLLYRGTPLLSALDWAGKNPDQVGEQERTFLDASVANKAREEASATERQKRARRLRHVAIAALGVLATGASAASVVAFMAFRDAQRNEITAASATEQAQERFAGALGAAAEGRVETDPILALALGAEAVARARSGLPAYAARSAMITARSVLTDSGPFLLGSPIGVGDALVIALSETGSHLAVGRRDGDILLFDTGTRKRIEPTLQGHVGGVRDLAFEPRGLNLASAGVDGTIRLWSAAGGSNASGTLVGETGGIIMEVKFSPDGKTLASSGERGVQLWDVEKRSAIGAPFTTGSLAYNTVAFAADGNGLLASYADASIYGWSLPDWQPLFEPIRTAHTSHLLELAVSPSGDRFATGSTDGKSVVMAYPSGQIIGQAFGKSEQIQSAAFLAGGRALAGGGSNGALHLWDVEKQESLGKTPAAHSQPIVNIKQNAQGTVLATLGRDQVVRLWNYGDGTPMSEVERRVTGKAAKGTAFSPDGKRLAVGDDAGLVHIWSLTDDSEPITLQGHQQQVWAVAFSADGELLASADRAGQVRAWAAASGEPVGKFADDGESIWSVIFTPDSKRLLTVGDRRIRTWELATGKALAAIDNPDSQFTRAVLAPDGNTLASASSDGSVEIWQLQDNSLLREFTADDNVLWSLAFSPDGRYLATASGDEIVAVWEIASARQIGAFTGHSGGATDVAFLADGVTLVATDRSGGLHWWDKSSGRRLSEALPAHSRASWRIALHPDGIRFATTGDDGRVRVWDQLSVKRACELTVAAFDAVRRRQYLGDGEPSVACDP